MPLTERLTFGVVSQWQLREQHRIRHEQPQLESGGGVTGQEDESGVCAPV
jgi:hypothetical protein